ncbi:MAG: Ni/Fe hydrogenase subunit gamma [Ignavibacteria bacterium]|nr:Ni/Fe hydrogenase subunit gamma [Ignavibacteria bacterium]
MFLSSPSMIPQLFSIQNIKNETRDTFTLELVSPDKLNISFHAGQFMMLYVFGIGEVPISISGNPTKTTKLLHTIRAVGTVTKQLKTMKRGDVIGVRGPFGSHWPVDESQGKDILIVAGGIGLAPLRPALLYILAYRQRYRKVTLLYGTRTADDLLFLSEIEQWRARLDLDVYITVDRSSKEWRGNVGVVTTLISKATFEPSKTVAMICGPEIMMRFVSVELQRCGVLVENIFVSLERNMKCAIGLCGHCQYGNIFVCKDGPVFAFPKIQHLFGKREL